MGFKGRVTLGRTGLRVSRLGLGAFYGISARSVERAFHEYGVNYLYWGSLPREGMGLALRHLARAYRQQMVVVLHSFDRSGALLTTSVEASLRVLGLDHADILVLTLRDHMPNDRVMRAAEQLIARGRVRYLGISGHNRAFFARLARMPSNPFHVFMLRYSAAHRGAEREILSLLSPDDPPGIVAFTATRWGHLLRPGWMPPGERPLSAADCYRFVLTHPRVDVCLTGPANDRQMEQGLAALEGGPMDAEELTRARRIGDAVHGHKGFSLRRGIIESRLARRGRRGA